MISCQDADVLSAALSVGSIDGPDQSELHHHLSGCADCRRVAGEYMAAAARLPLALELVPPPPELRGRLMRAVYAEAAQSGRQAARGARAPWWRRLWVGVPASRGMTVLAVTAAVALVGLSSWAVLNRHGGSPATVAVALVATQAAPHAHGELSYDRGSSEAVLTVSGLPSPAALGGRSAVYEVWLVPASGAPVAAAYLSHAPDGSWDAALAGDMSRYAAVAATVEPPGGSRVPTGPKVIQGSISSS